MTEELLRLAAFTTDPATGNPAGVHIGDRLPEATQMQVIAADVGYSETAFLAPEPEDQTSTWRVRYFSPMAEVDFCGHATIASGVALANRFGPGTYTLQTNVGPVAVVTTPDEAGMTAQLTSVEPQVRKVDPDLLAALLDVFGWSAEDLHADFTPAVAFAGVWHPILVLARRDTLSAMTYDFQTLGDLMTTNDWTTIQIVTPRADGGFDARDPFPVGGVVEDPATGAAAAALGAYLRDHGHVVPPARVLLTQGQDMGRTSHLSLTIPIGEGGIAVTGHAVDIPDQSSV